MVDSSFKLTSSAELRERLAKRGAEAQGKTLQYASELSEERTKQLGPKKQRRVLYRPDGTQEVVPSGPTLGTHARGDRYDIVKPDFETDFGRIKALPEFPEKFIHEAAKGTVRELHGLSRGIISSAAFGFIAKSMDVLAEHVGGKYANVMPTQLRDNYLRASEDLIAESKPAEIYETIAKGASEMAPYVGAFGAGRYLTTRLATAVTGKVIGGLGGGAVATGVGRLTGRAALSAGSALAEGAVEVPLSIGRDDDPEDIPGNVARVMALSFGIDYGLALTGAALKPSLLKSKTALRGFGERMHTRHGKPALRAASRALGKEKVGLANDLVAANKKLAEQTHIQRQARELYENGVVGPFRSADDLAAATKQAKRNLGKSTAKVTAISRKIRETEKQLRIKRNDQKALSRFFEEDIDFGQLTRQTPLGKPDSMTSRLGNAYRFLLRGSNNPKAIGAKLGAAAFKALNLADDADVAGRWHSNISAGQAIELRQAASVALGVPNKDIGKEIAKVIHLAETRGAAEAERIAPRAWIFVKQMAKDMTDEYDLIFRMGAEAPMTEPELLKMGVKFYWPHLFAGVDEKVLIKNVARNLQRQSRKKLTMQEAMTMAEKQLMAGSNKGPSKFASFDFRRLLKGSLQDKNFDDARAYIDDPFDAYAEYMSQVARRKHLGTHFGVNGELVPKYVAAVAAEGGDDILFENTLRYALGFKHYTGWGNRIAQNIVDTQTAAKMGFAWVPNAGQTMVNNPLYFGIRNSWAASYEVMKSGYRKPQLSAAVGLVDDIWRDLRRDMSNELLSDTLASRAAHFTLNKLTPFARGEQFNRYITAYTAQYSLKHELGKVLSGRVKGAALHRAERIFAEGGLSLKKITAKMKAGMTYEEAISPDELMTAVFRLTRRTQFIGSKAIRPEFWSHPLGRVLFQFQTFALNQGRLLRDTALTEAFHGNMMPMAYVLGVHPVIGEAINTGSDLLRDRKRRGKFFERYVNDLAAVGGFGIAASAIWGARYGSSALGMAGPTGRDAENVWAVLRSTINGDLPDKEILRLLKQPSLELPYQALRIGAAGWSKAGDLLEEQFAQYGERHFEEEGRGSKDEDEGLTLDELRRRFDTPE